MAVGKESNKEKRSRVKETFGELKKVSWPSFGKVVKATGIVLAVVLIFMVAIFGIDYLFNFLKDLLLK